MTFSAAILGPSSSCPPRKAARRMTQTEWIYAVIEIIVAMCAGLVAGYLLGRRERLKAP